MTADGDELRSPPEDPQSITGSGADRPTARVVSAGHINWDVTMHVSRLPDPDGEVRIDRLVQSGGGSAANVAVGLVGLGVPAAVYGSVGGDDSGALALRELDRSGVRTGSVLIDPEEQTSVKYLVVDEDGEVMVFANEGANESFSATEIDPDVLAGIDHLHLTGQRPETASELAAAADRRGASVSFDPGRAVGDRGYDAALARSDLLFLNDREAEIVAGGGTIDPYAPADRIVVVKRGADGATVYTPEGERQHAAYEIDPVDTTGAGDAFAAGFLSVLLDDRFPYTGKELPIDPGVYDRPLSIGNACGALAAKESTARVSLSPDRIDRLIGDS